MLLLEQSPHAGEPLLGGLASFRKLRVGNRHWRIVWRVTEDDLGGTEIEIAEVWAAGARADSEVHDEMHARVATVDDPGSVRPLAEVIEMLGRRIQREDLQPTPESDPDPVPTWLAERLTKTAGLDRAEVDAMTGARAMERWEAFLRGSN
jgi:mRNA interferase RelE/StbE